MDNETTITAEAASSPRSEYSESSRSQSSHRNRSSRDGGHRSSRDSYRHSERDRSRERRRRERSRDRSHLGERDGYSDSRTRDVNYEADRERPRSKYRHHSRSRSPGDRSGHRRREDDRPSDRRERPSHSREERAGSPRLSEDERDRRTIFVQQLAARLRTKQLISFFEQVGPVRDAQIVKDRISGRSKGVGYVEFRDLESIPKALNMTGQRLLDIPVIVQLTEAEKNRLARAESSAAAQAAMENQRQHSSSHQAYNRLYIGNIHFAITESDLKQIFESYGPVDFVVLQKDESGAKSKGFGFVQFEDRESAQNALELNGFKLGGRPIRVGLGNDKVNMESTESLLHRLSGGPGMEDVTDVHAQNTNSSAVLDTRLHSAGRGREEKKPTGALVSALDDSDTAGVSFTSVSRVSLMKKLLREEDAMPVEPEQPRKRPASTQPQTSRCIMLSNMFDPSEEDGENWVEELQEDVKAECEEKYGKVVHISVEANSSGEIFVKFADLSGGEKAILGLNGRYFGGRQITATPVVEMVYTLRFPKSKAL
ncbi:uncharacterized protein V1516DRAFT_504892 [Lipomyces oligophaga]|uniref:uncharacterized protein n=1 Tax=Lipomyces oligophaga TaxID=45792 RepID=UPI0034CDFA68